MCASPRGSRLQVSSDEGDDKAIGLVVDGPELFSTQAVSSVHILARWVVMGCGCRVTGEHEVSELERVYAESELVVSFQTRLRQLNRS